MRWILVLALAMAVGCSRDKDNDGVKNKDDCDPEDPMVFPGAPEYCDGLDNDCDGNVDDGAVDAALWYFDVDQDGYPGALITTLSCEKPDGYFPSYTDCDDLRREAFPGADETCNEADDDCDGDIDEDPVDPDPAFPDEDGDGFGDTNATPVYACDVPVGYTRNAGDCDDTDPSSYPWAPERCDDQDNDCDGSVDEDAWDAVVLYEDADGDYAGNPYKPQRFCDVAEGWVPRANDCDDEVATTFPGADELCNDVDDDCDGAVDEEPPYAPYWYLDVDGDGYGNDRLPKQACDEPSGYVDNGDDCNDLDPADYPGADEVCDHVDNDCDGTADEDATDMTTWYQDLDEDGYGRSTTYKDACFLPTGYINNSDDCDDSDPAIHPNARETCNLVDDNCDDFIDEDILGDGEDCPGVDCLDIVDAWYRPTSGLYWIDPTGSGDPIEVECDMATDGGGWTEITGAILYEQDWVDFSTVAGSGTVVAEWADSESFTLSADSAAECSTVAVRAVATLPLEFEEWYGEWTASGDSRFSHQDDSHDDLDWGETTTDCEGHLKFGTDVDDEKEGGEWGEDWNATHPYQQTWSWAVTTVTETDSFRWELLDDEADEDVTIDDISIWVR